jgi:hypothetical protein
MTLLALLACTTGDTADSWLPTATWDTTVVPAADGVYVRLTHAQALARVTADGTVTTVDLGGASPDRIIPAPDGQSLLVFASWPTCDDDDEEIRLVSDCPSDKLGTAYEFDLVRDGAVVTTADVPPQYNAFTFNADSSLAVAYLDLTSAETVDVTGILNLTEAVFIDTTSGETHPVSVGFAAERVLFTDDGTKAVVLSRSEVAMVDLASWTVSVSFPLTLDPDQVVVPTDVALVQHEGTDYALVSVSGREEIYVLDLTNESIDLVELAAVPGDMLVDTASDRTLVVYGSASRLDLVEHEAFETESITLDEPAGQILGGDGMALLYTPGSSRKDVVHFDTTTLATTEFRSENPIQDLRLTDDQAYAVALLSPEGGSGLLDSRYAMQIFDMVEKDDPVTLALGSAPVGLEIVADDGGTYALLLLDGLEQLLRVDLATAGSDEVELDAAPRGIGAMPDGTFVVTHDSALGMLTFIDAATGESTTVSGFAATNLLREAVLPRRDVE